MESITKNRQPIGVLRAMVARAFGPDLIPADDDWACELGYGWFNVVYRMRLRDGQAVALKVAPPRAVEVMTYERDAMATELAALRLIAERTDVPVPAVEFADQSRELCDAGYFFMPYIDADNLGIIRAELPRADLDAYHEALGAANRELNSIRGAGFGPLAGPVNPSWRAVFTGIVEDVLRDGERRQVDLGWDYDVIREVVAVHEGTLDEVTEPTFVEWDLGDGNVMIRGGEIVSILDHERAFFGDPLIEAGFTATQLPAFGDPVAFMRGYGRAELTETEHVRRRLPAPDPGHGHRDCVPRSHRPSAVSLGSRSARRRHGAVRAIVSLSGRPGREPQRDVGRLERFGDHANEVAPDGVEVHDLAQPRGEGGHDRIRVVARPIEATVHRMLHPPAKRVKQRRDGQGGHCHCHRRPDRQYLGCQDHQPGKDPGQHGGDDGIRDDPADDAVDLIQVILQHGHADADHQDGAPQLDDVIDHRPVGREALPGS
jgi:aminoglycoside phosphotransferase (APT) family kinase protein